ncbi:MAG: uracil-DNA glycosylase [Desulfobacterales bacterium]|nr:uracil-DNA glycosylase [Desulfobacterales bacterium]
MDSSELLKSLKSLIHYHQVCGIKGYQTDEKGRNALATVDIVALGGTEKKLQKTGELLPIAEIAAEISSCQSCSLHETRQIDTAGRGGQLPKLVIVGDWLMLSDKTAVQGGEIFGAQQDQMLARMIAAIDLKPDEVFVTNSIKCSIPESCQPTSRQLFTCTTYLQRQIDLLLPEVICTMGIIATKALTGKSRPLSQLRGKFYPYRSHAGGDIPLIPTYHPTYLLQNPEMKQATWADLQLIHKKLVELNIQK